jgi:hypothetical protein
MKQIANIVSVSLLVLLSACSMPKNVSLAEAEVPSFHASLDAGDFGPLYEAAAEELKKAAAKQEFVDLLNAIHRKLGQVTKSERQKWNINYNTSGSFVTLVYDTTFANGNGTEQFIYKLNNGRARLVGYRINSNALVIE